MELNEYQKKAMGTCMPSCKNFSYMMLNLVGEVGEFAGRLAKSIRKVESYIDADNVYFTNPFDKHRELRDDLKAEAGDILWQLSGLCEVMGWSLEDVAQANLEKLASRKERGVIDGNGDNR